MVRAQSARVRRYIPDRGHLVWLSFDPRAGRGQAGRRPALVLSPAGYNGRARLALVCPITSQVKGYPFEVALPGGLPIGGVVLADHLKSADWDARRAHLIGVAPAEVMEEVTAKLCPLLGIE
ncbi:MAG TPA: endoribonuclease MazF [Chloroflexota bacterium]|nr:endoribonuclease MazF [Chloroflexota bacterium]